MAAWVSDSVDAASPEPAHAVLDASPSLPLPHETEAFRLASGQTEESLLVAKPGTRLQVAPAQGHADIAELWGLSDLLHLNPRAVSAAVASYAQVWTSRLGFPLLS